MKSELGQHIVGSDLSKSRDTRWFPDMSRWFIGAARWFQGIWISNYYDNLSGGRIVLDDPHRVFCFQTFLHFCSLNKLLTCSPSNGEH
jgi:uncharacterized protein (DUF2237 family)